MAEKYNIIVTGASRGIGYETTKYLLNNCNCRVIAVTRNRKLLEDKLSDVNNDSLFIIEADIVNDELEIYDLINSKFDIIDGIVNNAGFLSNKNFIETDSTDFIKHLYVNLVAPAMLIKNVIPLLKKSKLKHVVNIGSMSGYQGSSRFPGLSVYGASKAAIASLTESLAVEFADMKIRFNCLALGAVNTEMLQEAFPGYKSDVNPNEMARFISDFLLSSSKVINGKTIPVALSTP